MDSRWSPVIMKRRFTEFEAWIDMLLMANHKGRQVGEVYVNRGQLLRSQVQLAERWKWNRKTVRRYLKGCQKLGEIGVMRDTPFTLITICNYNTYQGNSKEDYPPKYPPATQRLPTNNNDNNVNKEELFKNFEEGKLPFITDYEEQQLLLKEKKQDDN